MTVQKTLTAHRSIRKYKPTPISAETVREMVAAAVAGGSSSGNLNTYSVIVTTDPERRKRLWELHLEQDMILEAPVVVTICADHFRNRQWLAARGARDGFDNFLGYHVAAYDAMIMAQNLALAAQERGYGICYMGTTLYSTRELREFLKLPKTVFPVTSLVIGMPDEAPGKRDRMPINAIVHDEVYNPVGPATIDEQFAAKEAATWNRYMAIPELRRRIEELGIQNVAQFYTSKAKYDSDGQVHYARHLVSSLSEAGFLPGDGLVGTWDLSGPEAAGILICGVDAQAALSLKAQGAAPVFHTGPYQARDGVFEIIVEQSSDPEAEGKTLTWRLTHERDRITLDGALKGVRRPPSL